MPVDPSLKEQVDKWIAEQGYPLEFFAADAFERSGFKTRQSWHVHDVSDDSQNPREIDVVANIADDSLDPPVKLQYVIECKYAPSPWIIFSNSGNRRTPEEYINQTITNDTGSLLLPYISDDIELHELALFRGFERSGFNATVLKKQKNEGEKGKQYDTAYSALQSVVSAAVNLSKLYSESSPEGNQIVFFFPIIVIEGTIFDAYYDTESMKVVSQEVQHMQVHWRGLSSRKKISTVDIVSKTHLREFANLRKTESAVLLAKIQANAKAALTVYD